MSAPAPRPAAAASQPSCEPPPAPSPAQLLQREPPRPPSSLLLLARAFASAHMPPAPGPESRFYSSRPTIATRARTSAHPPGREAVPRGLRAGLRIPWLYYPCRTIKLDQAFVVRRNVPGLS